MIWVNIGFSALFVAGMSIVFLWGIGLSVGYVLGFQFGLGSKGLWIGQSVAIAVVAGLFVWRLRRLIAQRQGHHPLLAMPPSACD